MARLIVVCGLGGTGKTTLATALSRRLRIACLHKDSVKAVLHDRLGGIEGRTAFTVFTDLVEQQLANGVDLIVEATFHLDDGADIVRRWSETHGHHVLTVICRVDPAERRRRISARMRTATRHASHRAADQRELEDFERVTADYSTMPGRLLIVTTDEPVETCVDCVLAVIGPP